MGNPKKEAKEARAKARAESNEKRKREGADMVAEHQEEAKEMGEEVYNDKNRKYDENLKHDSSFLSFSLTLFSNVNLRASLLILLFRFRSGKVCRGCSLGGFDWIFAESLNLYTMLRGLTKTSVTHRTAFS